MIDTSLLIEYFRKSDKSNSRFFHLSQQFNNIAISSITVYEILLGATPSQQIFWQEMLNEMIILSFDNNAATKAAQVQQELKKKRKTIDKADLFIAATALAHEVTLDTLNRKHFEIIDGLQLLEV
jgi:tRNA(fMet)-specific endonuclease VapC